MGHITSFSIGTLSAGTEPSPKVSHILSCLPFYVRTEEGRQSGVLEVT